MVVSRLSFALLIVSLNLAHLVKALNCYQCMSTQFESASSLSGQAFDLSQISTTSDCNSGSAVTQSCSHACITVMSHSQADDLVLRGCADTIIAQQQWAELDISPDNLPETCYESETDISSEIAEKAVTKTCFCKSEKCNDKLWAQLHGKSGAPKSGRELFFWALFIAYAILCLS